MKRQLLILKLNRWDESYRSLYAWAELDGREVDITISQSISLDDLKPEKPQINWPAIGNVSEVGALKFTQLMVAAVETASQMEKIAEWKAFRLPKGWSVEHAGQFPHVKLGEHGPILMK